MTVEILSPPEPEVAASAPRLQTGPSPQHLIFTLLGDYWLNGEHPVPSATLVRMAAEFGVTEHGARAAVSRLAKRELIAVSRQGRRTFYRLTPRAASMARAGARTIMRFALEPLTWDGNWTFVAFSLPEEHRDIRHKLRSQLRWLGFAPSFDALWISPRASVESARGAIKEIGAPNTLVFRGQELPGEAGEPRLMDAWNLAEIAAVYEEFIQEYSSLLERIKAGQVSAAEALVARTSAMDQWRTIPTIDPELPGELLPASWPRHEARAIFASVYDTLGPLAEIRVRQLVEQEAPELVGGVHHHTTIEMLSD